MEIAVKHLEISNFRSIDHLVLENIPAFAVFAGPNGSGKSNFINAFEFIGKLVSYNFDTAMSMYNGIKDIIPYNVRILSRRDVAEIYANDNSRYNKPYEGFRFNINITYNNHEYKVNNEGIEYEFSLEPYETLLHSEYIDISGERIAQFNNASSETVQEYRDKLLMSSTDAQTSILNYNNAQSVSHAMMKNFLGGIKVIKINPHHQQAPLIDNRKYIDRFGKNLADVLFYIKENYSDIWEDIGEWINTMVPGLESIDIAISDLDGKKKIIFREKGITQPLPQHLISDGTIHLLCYLVAVLHRPEYGMTMIEEPENGLHPHVIRELVKLFREEATPNHPIWITTHSESVVRQTQQGELWLVDKKDGCTQIQQARPLAGKGFSMDEAWLCNVFGAGVPW